MLTDADWARIVRFVFGECDPTESSREQAWIDADPERHALAQELLGVRSAAPPVEPPWQTGRDWARFRDVTARNAGQPDAAPPHRRAEHVAGPPLHRAGNAHGWGARLLRPAIGFAAAAIVGVVGGLTWSTHAHTVRQAEMRELVTAPGQRVTLTLTDGTRITLGPASTIRYPREFSSRRRAVELEGEGYFEVHHNPQAPLVVRTPRALAEDIGTTFVVRDYVTDSEPQVTVAEGQVSMGPSHPVDTARQPRRRTVLSRGQVGALTSAGTTTVREDVDLGPEDGWARGELVFRHTRLRDALPELNRWFDMDIRLAEPSLGDLEVTTSFKDESVNDALNALTAAFGLVADGQGRDIVLRRASVRRAAQMRRHSAGVSFTSLDPGEAPHAP